MLVSDILEKINQIAPFETAMDFDNCGLLIGDKNCEVTSCILALDITNEIIDIAKNRHAQLIITHHPIIFEPLKRVLSDSLVFKLIKENISVISAHTNLDIAKNGVNDVLAKKCNIINPRLLENTEGVVKIGKIANEITANELAENIKSALNCQGVFVINGKKKVSTIAVASGAGNDFLTQAIAVGADCYVTGELKHNLQIDAVNNDLAVIIAGHHQTEVIVLDELMKTLQKDYPKTQFEIVNNFDITLI